MATKLFFFKTLAISALVLVPLLAFGQTQPHFSVTITHCASGVCTFSDLIRLFVDIINRAIPVIMSLALLVFFFGIARFVFNVGGGKEREDAKNIMFWGIIAMFVLFSVWGIVRILQATFIP